MRSNSFLQLIEQSIRTNWELPVFTDYQGKTFYYKDFAQEIEKMHDFFRASDLKRGDKVSICGRNSSNWAITFFSLLSYGAVAVSILHEFDKDSVQYIIDHSDSKMAFLDEAIWNNIDENYIPKVETVFSLEDFSLLKVTSKELKLFESNSFSFFDKKFEKGFFPNDVAFRTDKPEELAVINYTSGTTSSPKGVMIPYRSMWSNTRFSIDNLSFIQPGDAILCMLPMAHTYGLAFEILNSIAMGKHIYFLGKVPSPKILIDMFAKVKPKLVLAVPLIIEKIILRNVFPKLEEQPIKTLLKVPGLNQIVYKKVRKTLIELFGNNLVQVTIGGAALNETVESFLKKIKFPYTVGYGMTECGPLISYSYWSKFKQKSVGVPVDRMSVKIDSKNQEKAEGEILVKGSNLMLGYYNNQGATDEVMMPDGWMRTGDLGIMDKDGFIFIKGRNKNMILGSSGQNIYPEEIEEKINNSPFVMESLVIEENKKIIALIVPDTDVLKTKQITADMYPDFYKNVIKEINHKLPAYSRIADFHIQEEEFEKTPKRSIRRFKYQSNN